MGHDHHHTHDTSTGNIRVAFFLNFIFAIIELIGGIYTNSVSILSDALHDFGDSISLGVAWYLQKVSARRSDRFYSYGYKRFSLIGAIFISVVLLAVSVVVIKECIGRIIEPQMPDAAGMELAGQVHRIGGGAVLGLLPGVIRADQPGDHVEARRFPRAIGSQEADDLPLAHVHRHAVHDPSAAVFLHQPSRFDEQVGSFGFGHYRYLITPKNLSPKPRFGKTQLPFMA